MSKQLNNTGSLRTLPKTLDGEPAIDVTGGGGTGDAISIRGRLIQTGAPSDDQILQYNQVANIWQYQDLPPAPNAAYGQVYREASHTREVIGTTFNAWEPVDITTIPGALSDFDSPAPNTLRYTGTNPVTLCVSFSCDLEVTGPQTNDYIFRFARDGVRTEIGSAGTSLSNGREPTNLTMSFISETTPQNTVFSIEVLKDTDTTGDLEIIGSSLIAITFEGVSTGGGPDTSIYNTNGTLTSNRVVNLNSLDLSFTNGDIFLGNTGTTLDLAASEILIDNTSGVPGSLGLVSDGTTYRPLTPGVNGEILTVDTAQPQGLAWASSVPGTIITEFNGVIADSVTRTINFTGAGVSVTQPGPNEIDVTIGGGGGGVPDPLTINRLNVNEIGPNAGTFITLEDFNLSPVGPYSVAENAVYGINAAVGPGVFRSVAVGSLASSTGSGGCAIGNQSLSAGGTSVALGSFAEAVTAGCIAIGRSSQATSQGAIAIGRGCVSTGLSAIAIGDLSGAVGRSIALNGNSSPASVGINSDSGTNSIMISNGSWSAPNSVNENCLCIAGATGPSGLLNTFSDNAIFGHDVASTMENGQRNCIVGHSVLPATNLENRDLTLVGSQILDNTPAPNTISLRNVTCVGQDILRSYNVVDLAAPANITALGHTIGESMIGGFSNVLIGNNVPGPTPTFVSRSVFIGDSAGSDTGSPSEQIAIGSEAICTSNFSCQLGGPINQTIGLLRFRSQDVIRESWANGTVNDVQNDIDGNFTIVPSDRRSKQDIETITDGEEIVSKLRPVKFHWNEHYKSSLGDRLEYGFVAQEVEEAMGEDFCYAGDFLKGVEGEVRAKTIKHTDVIAPLVSAVQSLLKRVESLEQRTKKQSGVINRLKAKVKTLEG